MSEKEGFYGTRIFDDNESYYTEVDVKHDLNFNTGDSKVQETLTERTPYVTTLGEPNYWSGTCSGLFLDNTEECEHHYSMDDRKTAHMFAAVKFLGNHKKKMLQLSDDFIIPITVQSPIKVSPDKGLRATTANVSFNWTEVKEDGAKK